MVGATGRLSHGRPLQAKCERASRQPSKVTSPQCSVRVFYSIVVNTLAGLSSIYPTLFHSPRLLSHPFLVLDLPLSFILTLISFLLDVLPHDFSAFRSNPLRHVEQRSGGTLTPSSRDPCIQLTHVSKLKWNPIPKPIPSYMDYPQPITFAPSAHPYFSSPFGPRLSSPSSPP